MLELITARRAELDNREAQLVKQLTSVRAERDDLSVAERVLARLTGPIAQEGVTGEPVSGQAGGRPGVLIPHHKPGMDEGSLPPDYQRIIATVRRASGPLMTREVGEALGVEVSVKAKRELLRGKLVRLADRGWLRKLPDARFTTHP
ncbi:hypothetical protein ACFUJR_15290 [Streptomyces sp. NPDC057271]|uniref:hypothetical protein n=1 Tax=unclassified Streptomyces TaxID=2593676 RepID=UPI0036421A94